MSWISGSRVSRRKRFRLPTSKDWMNTFAPGRSGARELGMGAHIGSPADVGLMAGNELAVLREHQVRLDVIRPHLDGERVGRDRVLGSIRRASAVADDERQAAPVSTSIATSV